MKTTRKISEPVISRKVWNQIKVEKINYSVLTEDEMRLLKLVRKAEKKYFDNHPGG